jgi:hypothetical protein
VVVDEEDAGVDVLPCVDWLAHLGQVKVTNGG